MPISPKHPPHAALLSLSSVNLILVTLYGEARNQPIEAVAGVGNVILNRLQDGRWGDSIHAALLDWAEFSCLWAELGGLNFVKLLDFARGITALEAFTQREKQLHLIARGVIENALVDNTRGATHYHDHTIAPPFWAQPPAELTVKLGAFSFYRKVR